MAIESVMPSSHLILCRPLLLLPPILPSIRVFSNESTLRMRWPNTLSLEIGYLMAKVLKRWQEYTEELYKTALHDPEHHDSVITHLDPDILECEVKWALESITINKASTGVSLPPLLNIFCFF